MTTILFYAITFAYLWLLRRKKKTEELKASLIQTAIFTFLAWALFIVFYSAHYQYANLLGQHQMAIRDKENLDAQLKKAREEVIAHQALEIQLGARIDRVEEALKRLQEKEEEILHNLPKSKK